MRLATIGPPHQQLRWIKVQITRLCNLSCSFCSQADWHSKEILEVDRFIESMLSRIDVRLLIVTGGEPLAVFDELVRLVDYCTQRQIETGVFSNGTLASDERMEKLSDVGLSWIRVSLNGSSAESHERSYPLGSFDKTMQGIAAAGRHGMMVKIRTTVSQTNVSSVHEFVDFVASLGVAELDFRPYLPLGDCNPHDHFVLGPEELLRTAGQLDGLRERYPDLKIKLLPGWFDFVGLPNEARKLEECHCGRQYLYVDVNGNLMPCAGHRLVVGHIRDGGFERIWNESSELHQMRAYRQANYCQKCPSLIQCHRSSCSLVNYEANGSFSEVNPLCPVIKMDPDDPVNGHAMAQRLYENAKAQILECA